MSRVERKRAVSAARRRASETVSVTCCLDDYTHEVPDTELAVGATRRDGYYRALCGHMIAAAPMVTPAGRPCKQCVTMRRPATGQSHRRGLRRRLIG